MRYTYVRRQLPGGNPIANALVIAAGAVVITLALILGFFAFVALGSLVLVSAAVISLRIWWLRRKLARQRPAGDDDGNKPVAGVIEGEFRVVREKRDRS